VANNLRGLIKNSEVLKKWLNTDNTTTQDAIDEKIEEWLKERIGTIHTVQGREAQAVIFVLGATAPEQKGARGWAGRKPNLLNVAVTRAKDAIYVIGNNRV